MTKVKASLRPLVNKLNLPTVLKTTILPGDSIERLFIATQLGVIYYVGNGVIRTFLDIRPRIIKLGGSSGGYDERGLLGLAFHPEFRYNGLFYLHYSLAGTQGPGTLPGGFESFTPDPCDPATLNLRWENREAQYDHIDTVEEWMLHTNGQPQKRRTLLNLRRPFMNHNGVNSLNFSPETGKLILTTGDGGSGYDPFNLSQDDMEICGKIIEIDVGRNTFIDHTPVVTRFNELPASVQEMLAVMAKGVRNIPGISFQKVNNQYIKYVGNVGQDLVESVFSFVHYKSIPVTQLVRSFSMKSDLEMEGWINFGWRGWEGAFPTSTIRGCPANPGTDEITMAYCNDAVKTSAKCLEPLTCYFHKDPRYDKFGGTALTGVQSYSGNALPGLTGSVVFTDLARKENNRSPARGVLAYSRVSGDRKLHDYHVIETDDPYGSQSAYYVTLGANQDQTRLFLGVYGSTKVNDYNQGTVLEIIP